MNKFFQKKKMYRLLDECADMLAFLVLLCLVLFILFAAN